MEYAERRRSGRKTTNLPASFSYAAGTRTTSNGKVVTLNLSEHGAQLVSAQPLPVGEVITLTLILDGGTSLDLEARVVWVEQKGAEFRAGIAFRNMDPEQEYLIERRLSKIAGA